MIQVSIVGNIASISPWVIALSADTVQRVVSLMVRGKLQDNTSMAHMRNVLTKENVYVR